MKRTVDNGRRRFVISSAGVGTALIAGGLAGGKGDAMNDNSGSLRLRRPEKSSLGLLKRRNSFPPSTLPPDLADGYRSSIEASLAMP